jgi:hypothetical protein
MASALGPDAALGPDSSVETEDGVGPDTGEACAVDSDQPSTLGGTPGATQRLRAWWPDVLLAGLLSLAIFVVHNVGYMFSAPFWNDEAWVAISTKLPLRQIAHVSASTPVGWSLMLRLVLIGGDERLRIVPLVFSALTVITAYAYARSLPWPRLWLGRLAAVLAGVAALLVPSALVRDDLKQYTADAFVTLVILWLVSRLEAGWTRRRLVNLGVVVVAGFLFSAASAFVGAAAFGSVVLVALVGRRWRRLAESAVAGTATGVLLLLIFVVLYRPGIPAGLNNYWTGYYLPISEGWAAGWHYLFQRGHEMAAYLGMGPLVVALLLVVAGVVTLIRLGRTSVALIVPALLAEVIVLGTLKQYPLFDERTSHFLTTAFAVTAAIGVAGLCTLAARVHVGLVAVVAVVAVALFVINPQVHDAIRSQPIPAEDLRTPTRYIASHAQPRDIIVVGTLSSWGFAYYWDKGAPATEPVTANLQGFVTVFPDQPNILVATDRTPAAVDAVMDEAAAAAAKAGPTARIWVVHDHTQTAEAQAFAAAAQAHGLTSQTVIPRRLALLTQGAT